MKTSMHFNGAAGQAASDKVAERALERVVFEVRRGLLATLEQVDAAAVDTIAAAYAALAAEEGLSMPVGGVRGRVAVAYALQRAWYESGERPRPEPDRVRARREALYASLRDVAAEDASEPRRQAARPEGAPPAALLIRKGLSEGLGTAEIVASVAAFNAKARVDARTVAYYRHQMRKRGELPPADGGAER